MCGILAVFGDYRYKEIPLALVERGRDSQGVYQDEHCQLIQTRLEITPCDIELPYKQDGYVLLFNGEVYNWQEFGGNEYEAIVNAFKRFGTDLHNHLDGQFRIIIYNTTTRERHHFKDDFSIHALYYIRHKGNDIYASNLRSLPMAEFKQTQPRGYGNVTTATVL